MARASHGQDTTHGISSVDIHRLVEDAKSTTDTMDEVGVSSHKDKLGVMVVLGYKVKVSKVIEGQAEAAAQIFFTLAIQPS